MTVSQMHFMKTETRDMADRVRARASHFDAPIDDWRMSNATFLTAFVVIAGGIAMLALVLRLAA